MLKLKTIISSENNEVYINIRDLIIELQQQREMLYKKKEKTKSGETTLRALYDLEISWLNKLIDDFVKFDY